MTTPRIRPFLRFHKLSPDEVGQWVQATRRVGATLDQRARWLVDFVNSDLKTATVKECRDLVCQLVVFTTENNPGQWLLPSWFRLYDQRRHLRRSPMPLEEIHHRVLKLQKLLRDALTALWSQGWLEPPYAKPALRRAPDGVIVPVWIGDLRECFCSEAFQVIGQLGPRLRACAAPNCTKYFVQVRRQKYCSSRCSQHVRTATFQKARRDKFAQLKHVAYEKKQKEKFGPRVKVGRRPRKRLRSAKPSQGQTL